MLASRAETAASDRISSEARRRADRVAEARLAEDAFLDNVGAPGSDAAAARTGGPETAGSDEAELEEEAARAEREADRAAREAEGASRGKEDR